MPHLHHAASGSLESMLLTVIIIFAASVYLRGWLHLRWTSFRIMHGWRAVSFVAGLSLIWVAVASPLAALDHELLTAHMLKHLLLMTVAPPLIWLGEPVRAWSQGLPQFVRRARGIAFCWPLIMTTGRALVRPEVCWLAAAAALVGWHVPAVFTLAMPSAT